MFPTIEYLEWIEGRPERLQYDLGSIRNQNLLLTVRLEAQRLPDYPAQ